MTAFSDEELARLAKNPQHDISDLARELLQLRRQITPQAGEAEPVKCQHCNGTGEIEPDNNGPIGPCPICNGKGSYIPRTAPPRPVAPVWQPIETAPRDGTAIVGWSDDLKKRAFVFWKIHHGGNYWALVGQDHFSLSNVTLWQPLSPPPDSPGNTEES